MPVGTGAETLNTTPQEQFVVDPTAFMQMTLKNEFNARTITAPGSGQFSTAPLLQAGIVSKLFIEFVGTLVVSTAAVTTSNQWPYNLLSDFKLSINGQNDLWSCNGLDLKVLRFLRYPAYIEAVDQFPGTVGGGDSVATGTYNIRLGWEVPIAMDDTSLVGSLYAQSASTNLQVRLTQALNTDLFSANPANAALTGVFNVHETLFEVPFNDKGQLVTPDLSVLHGFNAVEVPYTNTGEARTPLIRSAGQLERLLFSVTKSTGNRLSAQPNASASNKIDAVRLEYGGNQRPYVYSPAARLLSINNQLYGGLLPYDRIGFDFVRENPVRDTILMAGVTELALVPTVNSSVTVANGAAVRVVQETLFS